MCFKIQLELHLSAENVNQVGLLPQENYPLTLAGGMTAYPTT